MYVLAEGQQTRQYIKFGIFVCMNAYNSETIRARTTKLGDKRSYYGSQINNVLYFRYTPFLPTKSKKKN